MHGSTRTTVTQSTAHLSNDKVSIHRRATCPVLLILLSNMPLSRKLKRPTDTLTLLILDQLMIVFGVGAIVYGGPAKVVLFLLGLAAGGGIFYIMYDVWARCIQSYPESAHHGVNALFGLFFTSWTCFPRKSYHFLFAMTRSLRAQCSRLIARDLQGYMRSRINIRSDDLDDTRICR